MRLRGLVRVYLILIALMLKLGVISGYANVVYSGEDLPQNKEAVELHADSLEILEKEGIAIFDGNVSIVQGERVLRTLKLIVYYDQDHKKIDIDQTNAQSIWPVETGLKDIKKIEALGEVYIKIATQIATGDKGIFDKQSNSVILTGNPVVLRDGSNTATGCRLTVNMATEKTFLEGCEVLDKNGRVSIILQSN
ncbi:LptA/OstA family protein [Bartonella ancashensis]|nr:LptA/OstA family protein [Bartonella ancashensis]